MKNLSGEDLDSIMRLLNSATSWQKFMIDCTLHGYDASSCLPQIAQHVISKLASGSTAMEEGVPYASRNKFENDLWKVSNMLKPAAESMNEELPQGMPKPACLVANGLLNFLDMYLDTGDLDFIASRETAAEVAGLSQGLVVGSPWDFKGDEHEYSIYEDGTANHSADAMSALLLKALSMKGLNFFNLTMDSGFPIIEEIVQKTGMARYAAYMSRFRADDAVADMKLFIQDYYKYKMHVLIRAGSPASSSKLCNSVILSVLHDSAKSIKKLDKAVEAWQRRREDRRSR